MVASQVLIDYFFISTGIHQIPQTMLGVDERTVSRCLKPLPLCNSLCVRSTIINDADWIDSKTIDGKSYQSLTVSLQIPKG